MKILLVDSDSATIQSLLPALKALPGHEIRVALNGEKALENAQALGGVDLLLTEVIMDPMNGFTLRNKLRKRCPGLKTVFFSSYDLSEFKEHVENSPTLSKPLDTGAIVQLVSAMGTPPPAPNPATGALRPIPLGTSRVLSAVASAPGVKPTAATSPSSTGALKRMTSRVSAPKPARPGEKLEGTLLGAYEITRKLGSNSWGELYQAVQIGMDRKVALEILSPKRAKDPDAQQRFISNAVAKAKVKHPLVISVFEAGHVEDWHFYAYEYVEGETLKQRLDGGNAIDGAMALQLVTNIADAMGYLSQNQIPHTALDASAIFLGANNLIRLANIAKRPKPDAAAGPGESEEIITLAQIVRGALKAQISTGLAELLEAMENGALRSWAEVSEKCQALQPRVAPAAAEARKLRAHDDVVEEVVQETRKQHKRQAMWTLASLVSLVTLGAVGAWWFLRSNERSFGQFVRVPAGEFIFQDGQKATLPEFWISQHEVSFGQYAKFIQYLDAHPEEATKFDHPRQPKGKSHKIKDWDIFYGRARAGKPVKFIPIDLNSPIFLVDWWDAYAYAKWMGLRLPTEQEWEKAARGTDGRLYPWGNQWDPKKCNSAADFSEDPTTPASVDGYKHWAPVDAFPSDKSPYGALGMAGNVSEWTDTWVNNNANPVIRGGNYHTKGNELTKRVTELIPEQAYEFLGFRVASDKAP